MKNTILRILICVMLGSTATSFGNLVKNGGFEEPHFEGEGVQYLYGGDAIDNWVVTENDFSPMVAMLYDTGGLANSYNINFLEGTQALHIGEASKNRTITQSIIGFTAGVEYEVKFGVINWGVGYPPHEIDVQVYNAATASFDLNASLAVTAMRDWTVVNDMEYVSAQFTATGTTLDLMITNPYGSGMTIDDVSITPEPTTLMLLTLGTLALRKRKA